MMVEGRVQIYLGKKLKEKARRYGLNISEIARQAVRRRIEEIEGRPFEPERPKFIILIRCPRCRSFFQTSTIKKATCPHCSHQMRVYTKRGGLRGRVLEGAEAVREEIRRLLREG